MSIEIHKDRSSSSYVATVEMKNGEPVNDNGFVKQIRELISAINKTQDKKLYTKLRGRGPRKKIAMEELDIPEDYAGRYFAQDLPLKYAETADLYVYERRNYN